MPNYRRDRESSTYFFTVVTYQRRAILCFDLCRKNLREVIEEVQTSHPFKIEAWVLLPDHMHCIWKLPDGDTDYSKRWGLIKKKFTAAAKNLVAAVHPAKSREQRREGTIWQRRFWEHRVRDQKDFHSHCEYIHYNPVKHGLAKSPKDWPYSTFHKFVSEGIYHLNWGTGQEIRIDDHIGHE